jgi:methionine sulfoxide reductase heme-binding subunit
LKPIAVLKPLIFAAALIPAAALVYGFYTSNLTADPGDYITDQTGTWALVFLMLSLTITPIRRLTGWNAVIRLRRMIGLFSFFYGVLHMLTWVVFINVFDPRAMVADVAMRPYITVGMATFAILFVLALTSNAFATRRLGRRWQTLHRLVYVAAIGGVVHFWWLVKADITEPRRWAVLLGVLFALRVWFAYQRRQRAATVADAQRA